METTVLSAFRRIVREGALSVAFPSGRRASLGDGSGPPVALRLTTPAAVRRMALDPALALGECYMEGTLVLETGDVVTLLTILKRGGLARGWTAGAVLHHFWRAAKAGLQERAGPALAGRRIRHHYDLNEALFRLFLDPDMNYSCAYFEAEGQSLADAQRAKQRLIAAKLKAKPGARILDIGSGWGGMALYLARLGHDVTGITLSPEQARVATERAAAAGLSARCRFRVEDYRRTEGRFDHIVSIGMLEHVGRPQLRPFYRTIAARLDKRGTALIHAMAQPRRQAYAQPWGDKYIFPGGYIPSLAEITPGMEAAGLLIRDIEVLPLHYAETCRHWRERFLARADEAEALYDARFVRMWEMYLAGAETSFRHERIFVAHTLLARHQDRLPMRRDWIAEECARLQSIEAGWAG